MQRREVLKLFIGATAGALLGPNLSPVQAASPGQVTETNQAAAMELRQKMTNLRHTTWLHLKPSIEKSAQAHSQLLEEQAVFCQVAPTGKRGLPIAAIGPGRLSIEGQRYSLEDPTDRMVAGGLIETYLIEKFGNPQKELSRPVEETWDRIKKLHYSVQVADFIPSIQYVEPNHLADMQKAIALLRSRNFVLPRYVGITIYPRSGNYYSASNEVLEFEPDTFLESLALFYANTVSEYVSSFDKSIINAKDQPIHEHHPDYRKTVFFDSYRHWVDDRRDFQTSFATYLRDGNSMRARLAYAQRHHSPQVAEAIRRRLFTHNAFFGFETLADFEVKEDYPLEAGTVVEVRDYNIHERGKGILVKPTATTGKNPDWPLVHDGETLMLTGEEAPVDYHDESETLIFRKARVLTLGIEGFVPEQYLRPKKSAA